MMNVKLPSGTRIELTEQEVAKVEDLVRRTVSPEDLGMIVSNIGSTPDFSAIYTSNSGMHTATVQVSLKEDHKIGSYEYMARVRAAHRARDARDHRLFPIRRPGGRGAEPGHAGAHRRAGGRLESRSRAIRLATQPGRARSARSTASATFTFRRISIIRRCSSISTAPRAANWASRRRKSSTTSSPRSPPTP